MRKVLPFLLVLFAASPASAVTPDLSGEQLKTVCASWTQKDESFCAGYIAGTYDAFAGLSAARQLRQPVCVPDGTDPQEVVRVVKAWLSTSSFDLRFSGAFVVYKALRSFYPCAEKK